MNKKRMLFLKEKKRNKIGKNEKNLDSEYKEGSGMRIKWQR